MIIRGSWKFPELNGFMNRFSKYRSRITSSCEIFGSCQTSLPVIKLFRSKPRKKFFKARRGWTGALREGEYPLITGQKILSASRQLSTSSEPSSQCCHSRHRSLVVVVCAKDAASASRIAHMYVQCLCHSSNWVSTSDAPCVIINAHIHISGTKRHLQSRQSPHLPNTLLPC